MEVEQWLTTAKLEQFAEQLFSEGAESMAIPRALDAESVTVVIGQARMGVGHAKTFRAALVKLGNKNAHAKNTADNRPRERADVHWAQRPAADNCDPAVKPEPATQVVAHPQPVPYNARCTAHFPLQELFPQVILSYCTYTDGGLGKEHVWDVANILHDAGISSFHGYMVEAGQDWVRLQQL